MKPMYYTEDNGFNQEGEYLNGVIDRLKEDSFGYIVKEVDGFIAVHSKELMKMVGSVSEKTYKLKDPQGNPLLRH